MIHIHKLLKTSYLLLLAIGPSYSYSMYLALEAENSSFPIQTYPSDLQCKVFESILSHLNNYQTNFFDDNQTQDKEEIKKIGVLRYQIASFVIENLLKNSISPPPQKSHSINAIKDILYRGFVHIPFFKMQKMNAFELLKNTLKYKPVTNMINENINIPDTITDIFQNNIKSLKKNINKKDFNYPGRENVFIILKEELKNNNQKQNSENTPLLNNRMQKLPNQIIIRPKDSHLLIVSFIGVIIFYSVLIPSILLLSRV